MASFVNLFAFTCLYCALALIFRQIRRLHTNYNLAKRTGLHIFIAPVDPYGIIWQAGSRLLKPLLRHLQWCRIIDLSWTWEDDCTWHEKYGENFIVVTPAVNIIYTSDKIAIEEVLANRKVFVKPRIYEQMNIFGKNVDTVNGEEWSRHRKITAPCFNERVSRFVWDESIRQSQAMLAQWLSEGKVSNMVDDTRIVALHVLCAAGFGVQHDFKGGARVSAPGHKLSHRDALMVILNNFIATMVIVPQKQFFHHVAKLLSPHMNRVLLAVNEFRQYTEEAIALERRLLAEHSGAERHNLMSTLIRTSDQAKAHNVQCANILTDDEIKGNIFIFNVAGHDTTANTLAYAFALLAINPEIQQWVIEEIDEALQGEEVSKYEHAYPLLNRIIAVMYETLRLFGPVAQIPRGVTGHDTTLTITRPHSPASTESTSSTATLVIPPNTAVNLNVHAMHTTPSTYRNQKEWNPKRWISSDASATQPTPSISKILQNEKLVHMEQGFAPWAGGPRICPGMKFSQVEFTAVVSEVLKKAWIAPSVKGGEDGDLVAARKEVEALLRDSHHIGATISLKHPEDLWLKVSRR